MRKPTTLITLLAMLASLVLLAGPAGATVGGPTCEVPTDYATIQAAIADAGCMTIEVAPGTYTENLTISRDLALVSTGGAGATTIQGISSVGALGAILVTGTTSSVQIGGIGQGFTIVGIDNGAPGIENAAIYLRGTHSGITVQGNEVVANGDHGLLSEFGAVMSGLVVDSNTFSGQTFVGANPGGLGFGSQFSTPNVPRQLVTVGGGSGGGSTSSTTFTNNAVVGVAGGYNTSAQEQGNTLVTVDSNGATITGNTFAGTTSRFATSLRARGPATTISGNAFDSTGISFPLKATGQVFVQNTGQAVEAVAAANTFDKGVYVAGPVGTIGLSIEAYVEAVGGTFPAGTTVNVLPGTYTEGPQVVASADLTLAGADRSTTIVQSGGDTGTSSNSRGWFLVNPGVDVHVSGLTFDGNGFRTWQAFRHLGSGTFDDVAFTDIQYSASGSPYAGTAIAAFGGLNVDVTNSTFSQIGRIGVQYFGAGTTGTFSGNTYTGKGTGDFLDYGVEIGAGAVATISDNVITDNRGVAASDGSTSAGILITTFFGPGSAATITDNTISDNTTGLAVGFDTNDTSVVTVEGNTIADNDFGIRLVEAAVASAANRNAIVGNGVGVLNGDDDGDVFDATCNWWDDPFGPSGFGPGAGDPVSDLVDFSAWLLDSDLSGDCIGGGNRATKLAAIAALEALVPASDKDAKRIEKAIEEIQDSLDPEYWVDDTTLDPKDGKKVFDREKKAVHELMKLDDPSAVTDQVIQALLEVDERLAQVAIDDAIAGGGDQKDIDKAIERMADAAEEIADGDFDKAIEDYRKAWEYAQKAMD